MSTVARPSVPAAPPRVPTEPPLHERVLAPLWGAGSGWWILFLLAVGGTMLFVGCFAYSVAVGTGVWGNNIPVAWAFPITNFVWWIGIGHAGTFISAFLLLLNQRWRSGVNRLAETMTLFALVNAGLFPVLHLGRPWFLYWLVPYPATMGVWPNFKSSLPWDIAAVLTYTIISILFWYVGLLPDLALARSLAKTQRQRKFYGIISLGWNGSGKEWARRGYATLILAGIAAPLVVSVHSVVSLDFTIAMVPGWHSTIFPPYFVIGAIYSGFAMVLVLCVLVRRAYHVQDVITDAHLDRLAKLTLAIGLVLAYCYVSELFTAWYSGDFYERLQHFVHRTRGPIAVLYWLMMVLNLLTPQLFWWKRFRRSPLVLLLAGIAILIGMWLERFVIIAGSLERDFLPSTWHSYFPTWVDISILAGSLALFAALYLLFLRFLPLAAVSEIRGNEFLQEGQAHG
jgi:molybdopterin-containing oxidoreductase family membrane subunit